MAKLDRPPIHPQTNTGLIKRITTPNDPDLVLLEKLQKEPLVKIRIDKSECTDFVLDENGKLGIHRCKSVNLSGFCYSFPEGEWMVPVSIRDQIETQKEAKQSFEKIAKRTDGLTNILNLDGAMDPLYHAHVPNANYQFRHTSSTIEQANMERRFQHIQEKKKQQERNNAPQINGSYAG